MKFFKNLHGILFLLLFSLIIACPGDDLEKALEEAKFKLDKGFIDLGTTSVTATSLYAVLVCDSTEGTCPDLCDESKEDCEGETSSSDTATAVKTLKEYAAEARAILTPYFSDSTIDPRVAKRDKEFIRLFHVLYSETILGSHGVSFIKMGPAFMKAGETSSSSGSSLFSIFDTLIPADLEPDTALTDFQLANNILDGYNNNFKKTLKNAATTDDSDDASNSTDLEVLAVQGLINFFILSTVGTVIAGGAENFEPGKITDAQASAFIDAMVKTPELFADQLGIDASVLTSLFSDGSTLESQLAAGGDPSDIVDAYLATQYGK